MEGYFSLVALRHFSVCKFLWMLYCVLVAFLFRLQDRITSISIYDMDNT